MCFVLSFQTSRAFEVLVVTFKLVHYFLHVLFDINLLKPTGYVMHHVFNIQQLYALPTLYLCALFGCQNKQTSATYIIN